MSELLPPLACLSCALVVRLQMPSLSPSLTLLVVTLCPPATELRANEFSLSLPLISLQAASGSGAEGKQLLLCHSCLFALPPSLHLPATLALDAASDAQVGAVSERESERVSEVARGE